MNGKKATKRTSQMQSTTYFNVQIEGRERHPYGLAGPFKTIEEADRALEWAGSCLLAQGHGDLELIIWECQFFDTIELEWDERFQESDEGATVSQSHSQERVAA